MAGSRVVVGGNSPVWLGPTLSGLGLVAWLGAGAMAHADAIEPPPQNPEGAQQEKVVDTVQPPAEEEPIVIVEEDDESPAASPPEPAVPAAPPEPEVCARAVELIFANGESELDRAEQLRSFVSVADEFADNKIVIEGYASPDGSPRTNLELSHRRATQAMNKLKKLGIDPERMTVQAYGEYRPNMDGDVDRDRRVVVKIVGVATCPKQEGEKE